jgi:soluble lytic murein transglycosylase-like protein
MLAVSYAGGMPGLAVSLGGRIEARDGRYLDSADYPLPDWRPTSGWSIDRALLLAIARQESSFNPKAKSPCGAVGLMQLMPSTARSMGAGKLTDPQVNLELGQRYVHRLLDDDTVKGNLLFLAASYNSGPGNVARWLQNVRHNGDALLFMESIPVHETRAFVERVMTNFWAYRNRLGQTSPSLDAIAAGDWPLYDGGESKIQAVKHVKN